MNLSARRLLTAALAACVLGLALCPLPYIAVGALFRFPPLFSLVMLPPWLLGSGLLLWRYLRKPTEPPAPTAGTRRAVLIFALEGASWIAIATFAYFISGFTLMTSAERVGAACTAFLFTGAGCLPLALARRTALERRLAALPSAAAAILLLLLLVATGAAAAAYLLAPPAFI